MDILSVNKEGKFVLYLENFPFMEIENGICSKIRTPYLALANNIIIA
jgi:hypothetical protein